MFWMWIAYAWAGDKNTLSVDVVDGGLMWAANILVARNGTPINYEGVPWNVEGIHYRVVNIDGESVRQRTVIKELKFTYPANATARQALEAAVVAANGRPDAEAIYIINEDQGVLNLVPTQIRTPSGFVPYTPLLDTIITLPSATGVPIDLYHSVVETLSRTTGLPIHDAKVEATMSAKGAPSVRLPSATGSVRSLLTQIVASSDYAREWRVMWVVADDEEHGWNLSFQMAQPSEDRLLNRTPLEGR